MEEIAVFKINVFLNFVQESLRGEVRSLQLIVDHHPDVAKFQIDSESLKSEIKRLRRESQSSALDKQKAVELEQVFTELQAKIGKGCILSLLRQFQTI